MLSNNFPTGGGLDVNGYTKTARIKPTLPSISAGDIVQSNSVFSRMNNYWGLTNAAPYYCTMIKLREATSTVYGIIFCVYSDSNKNLWGVFIRYGTDGNWSTPNPPVQITTSPAQSQPKLYLARGNDTVILMHSRAAGGSPGVFIKCLHVVPDGLVQGTDYIGHGPEYYLYDTHYEYFDICGLNSEFQSMRVLTCGRDYTGQTKLRVCEVEQGSFSMTIGAVSTPGMTPSGQTLTYIRPNQAYFAVTTSNGYMDDKCIITSGLTVTAITGVTGRTLFQNGTHLLATNRLTEFTYVNHYIVTDVNMMASQYFTVNGDPASSITRKSFWTFPTSSSTPVAVAQAARGVFVEDRNQMSIRGMYAYGASGSPSVEMIEEMVTHSTLAGSIQSRVTCDANMQGGMTMIQITPTRYLVPWFLAGAPHIQIINLDFVPELTAWNYWFGARPGVATNSGVANEVIPFVAPENY